MLSKLFYENDCVFSNDITLEAYLGILLMSNTNMLVFALDWKISA